MTEVNFAKVRKKFEKNEDKNYHSENVVLIALHCGSELDHNEAKDIQRKHMEMGHLTIDLNTRRSALWDKLKKTPNYNKIFSNKEI
jgi:hypothetical protein